MEVLGNLGGLSLVELIIVSFIAMNIALAGACILQHSAKRLISKDE